MALKRALKALLAEVRVAAKDNPELREVKHQIKKDLAKEKERHANTDKCVSPVRREGE